MSDPNLNALWCRCIAEELRRGGVEHAVLCPGSRNAPLLFAIDAVFGGKAVVHTEERSGAFMALGMAKASGAPALICCTSGSAVANCLPALCEAHAAGIPLIVVAADRPWELKDCGAPQAMPQAGAFTAFLEEELALGEPTEGEQQILALRSRVSRIAQCGGPALVNVPMREPLAPIADPGWKEPVLPELARGGRADARPFTISGSRTTNGNLFRWEDDVSGIQLRRGMRGVIVVGPLMVRGQLAREMSIGIDGLSHSTGFPVVADASSPATLVADAVRAGDILVQGSLGKQAPDLVIACGSLPLARSTYEWIARLVCPLILVESVANQDFLSRAAVSVIDPHMEAFLEIGHRCESGDTAWRERWLAADRAVRADLAAAMYEEPWGENLAAHLALNHSGFSLVHLASSMPVRHTNLHLLPREQHVQVHSNRGINGIDGTIGTFFGELIAARADQPDSRGLLLVGDLAFLHDLPALAAAKHAGPGAIVILNNDGGGIFDFLPVAAAPGYERLVRTPHGLTFAGAAAQFDLPYARVESADALRTALDQAAAGDRPTIVECAVARPDAVERHRALIARLIAAGNSPSTTPPRGA